MKKKLKKSILSLEEISEFESLYERANKLIAYFMKIGVDIDKHPLWARIKLFLSYFAQMPFHLVKDFADSILANRQIKKRISELEVKYHCDGVDYGDWFIGISESLLAEAIVGGLKSMDKQNRETR